MRAGRRASRDEQRGVDKAALDGDVARRLGQYRPQPSARKGRVECTVEYRDEQAREGGASGCGHGALPPVHSRGAFDPLCDYVAERGEPSALKRVHGDRALVKEPLPGLQEGRAQHRNRSLPLLDRRQRRRRGGRRRPWRRRHEQAPAGRILPRQATKAAASYKLPLTLHHASKSLQGGSLQK